MKRSKHGLFVFPPKKTLIWRRHCSISQSCCSMTSKRSIGWFLESSLGMKFFHLTVCLTNQKPHAFVSLRQTNQIAQFLFCSHVFISGHTKIALCDSSLSNRCGVASYLYRNCFEITYVNRRPIRYGLNITLQKAVAFSMVKISRSFGDQHDGPQ